VANTRSGGRLGAQKVDQFGHLIGLGYESYRSALSPSQLTFAQVVGAGEHDLDVRKERTQLSRQLQSVDARHHEVHEGEVEVPTRQRLESVRRTRGASNIESVETQRDGQSLALGFLVIDDQDAR